MGIRCRTTCQDGIAYVGAVERAVVGVRIVLLLERASLVSHSGFRRTIRYSGQSRSELWRGESARRQAPSYPSRLSTAVRRLSDPVKGLWCLLAPRIGAAIAPADSLTNRTSPQLRLDIPLIWQAPCSSVPAANSLIRVVYRAILQPRHSLLSLSRTSPMTTVSSASFVPLFQSLSLLQPFSRHYPDLAITV